jgi:hypothetical protein
MVWLATKKTTCAKAALPRRAPSPVRNMLKEFELALVQVFLI